VSETVEKYLRKSISLSDIVKRLLRGWLFALIGSVIGIVAGIYVVWVTPPSYTVSVTLLPLDAGSADTTSNGGFGLQVLGSLLGSNGPVPKFTRFVASLYSTGLAASMDRKYDTSCTIFNCDRKTRQWPKRTGIYAWISGTVAHVAHLPDPNRPRDATDLAKYIEANVVIGSDKNTKMLDLSIDTREPVMASQFLVNLVDAANDYIKNQDNEIVRKEVDYITLQLKTNSDLSQRDALAKMLEDQEQHLMMTAVDLPYVARIQDGPTVEASNAAIKYLSAFVLFGFLIGGGLGIAFSFVPPHKRFWSRSWKSY
jgi:hypothetical protein